MTLALTLLARRDVIQVTDRLLTTQQGAFDRHANKNIVFWAKNGIFVLAYSGPAYLQGKPMDQQIAEILWGKDIYMREPGRPVAATFGRAGHWLDIGSAVAKISGDLEGTLSGARTQWPHRMEVTIAGWQWSRGTLVGRPVLYTIRGSIDRDGHWKLRYGCRLPRYWHLEEPPCVYLSPLPQPGPVSKRILHEIAGEVAVHGANVAERLLVRAIRGAARRSPAVGEDCMSIRLFPPGARRVDIRYVSQRESPALAIGTLLLPAAYSPWVIGPRGVFAPSYVAGSSSFQIGPITVNIRTPPLDPELGEQSALSSQARPLPD